MIKNIVLDVGGVIFDDSKQNIQKLLNKNCCCHSIFPFIGGISAAAD